MPEPKHKHTIFYVFKDEAFLSPTRGDRINELYFLQALAKHFDVYYNGTPFASSDQTAGNPDIAIAPPTRRFDLHIVRNNPTYFLGLPSPKMTMAYPYDEKVFAAADCLFTITERWREILMDWNQQPEHKFAETWYPDKIIEPKQLINLGQIPSTQIKPLPRNHPGVARYRLLFSNAPFVAGYFGRLDDTEYLPMLFDAFAS
ncbi:MAG: hypothetical protein P8J87_14995, partial [Verrucomicrobiales bacterium]|nr:hypothetical protein [Verrucomicrobiales bacterium]